jgi:hypothetical protein
MQQSQKGIEMTLKNYIQRFNELKMEQRQLERNFKEAARKVDILQMQAIINRLKVVDDQIANLEQPTEIKSTWVGVSQYFQD